MQAQLANANMEETAAQLYSIGPGVSPGYETTPFKDNFDHLQALEEEAN